MAEADTSGAVNWWRAVSGLNATVLNFWRWEFSDLRNATRGILPEFLVAWAVSDNRGPLAEWDSFDVQAPDGTRIEVKCSAFPQSWAQKRALNPVVQAPHRPRVR